MSAYMVDRIHIEYLLAAASHRAISQGTLYYGPHEQRQTFGLCESRERHEEVGQMLWDENRKSIDYRYPDCAGNDENCPGEVGEDFRYQHSGRCWSKMDAVQVIKACHCYRYQSCEHPGWERSLAASFIEVLIAAAVHSLPGYDAAEWGAPEPERGMIRLSSLR